MDVLTELGELIGEVNVMPGDGLHSDYTHDEALTARPRHPLCLATPASAADVVSIVRYAAERGVPLTARGSGTGLCGACIPDEKGILVSFERMNRIIEIDVDNHVAVVEPGVTLAQLDEATAAHGLVYPVFPGELSSSLGGNVATNAGGMRAVKYGVTRHQVLGVEAVLGTGEVVRTGGKFVKATTGYDLTQLLIGSEGTLALVTEATLRLYPRLPHGATLLVPFPTLEDVTGAVPRVIASGAGPVILEYIDMISLAAIMSSAGLDLGVPQAVREAATAYLVVVLEDRDAAHLDQAVGEVAELLGGLGAIDVFVLPSQAGARLIEAREKAFFVAKAAGANDIIDTVVPRAALARYMAEVNRLAAESGSGVFGCGHAGDGNVHLSVYQPDPQVRHELQLGIFRACKSFGGTVSGEHGIGTEKRAYFLELEDPAKLALMRRVKAAFDPKGILGPGVLLGPVEAPGTIGEPAVAGGDGTGAA
jgi:glycolate oxidase